ASFFVWSGRRHTRFPRDWSSDVCSSDRTEGEAGSKGLGGEGAGAAEGNRPRKASSGWASRPQSGAASSAALQEGSAARRGEPEEIGRASCREGWWGPAVGGGVAHSRGGW